MNLLSGPIEEGDWQETIARRLATIRGRDEPNSNEFYEASEAGAALLEAGYVLTRRS